MDPPKKRRFDAQAFLNSPGMARTVEDYPPAATIYSQGHTSDSIRHIHQGGAELPVVSESGDEAVVGRLGDGAVFGEGALAGQPVLLATATAIAQSRILVVPKRQMVRPLRRQHALADRFIAHMLARNARLEA